MNKKSNRPVSYTHFNLLRGGFTLIEIILVVLIILIVSGISLPYFAQSFHGSRLKIASRIIAKSALYARNMAILRGTKYTMKLTEDTVEILVDNPSQQTVQTEEDNNITDENTLIRNPNRIFRQTLPAGIVITEFEKETDEEPEENAYYVNYYPNGMSDEFRLVFEDPHKVAIEIRSDPVTGKLHFEFVQ